jgi:hypothetical protein
MTKRKHLITILGLVVLGSLAGSAFAVTSAQAHNWLSNHLKIVNNSALDVTIEMEPKTTAVIKGTVMGGEFLLTATTLDSDNGLLTQSGTTAKDSGSLTLSGLTVDKPAGCTVTSPVETKPLTSEVVTHTGSNLVYDKWFAETGETIATVTVTGCGIAGSYALKSKEFFSKGNEFGVEVVNQPFEFSEAINKTLKGSMTLAGNAVEFTASTTTHLIGGALGGEFGVE